MQKDKSKILIFNLKNRQEDYAKCLEFIKLCQLERINQVQKETMLKLAENTVTMGELENKNIAQKYLEMPLTQTLENSTRLTISNKQNFSSADIPYIINHRDAIRYYIRIHFVDEDKDIEIINLQYLALLLRRMKDFNFFDRIQKRRFTTFLVPSTGDEYPFSNDNNETDYDTYLLATQYLRLISKEYTGSIFGVTQEKGETVVKPLAFRKASKYEINFPLLLINAEKYKRLFEVMISEHQYGMMYKFKNGENLGRANDENPEIALEDFILETAIKRLRYPYMMALDKNINIKEKMKFVLETFKKRGNGSIMHFSIFSFLLENTCNKNENDLKMIINRVWYLSYELCQGLKQVVQNSIQHSQIKEGLFTFYLHQNRENEERAAFCKRIQKRYPDTDILHSGINNSYEALEVFISDINEENDMIENFTENLEYEKKIECQNNELLEGHVSLLQKKEQIAIRNFFSEFYEGDLIFEWNDFRKQDLVAHVGLSLFSLIAQQCKASVMVCSSKKYLIENSKNYFYKSYSYKGVSNVDDLFKQKHVIPGTQFSVLLPIHEWEEFSSKGLGQFQHSSGIKEDYKSFAKYLKYEERHVRRIKRIASTSSVNQILTAKGKYNEVILWRNYWHQRMEDVFEESNNENKYVYVFDFQIDENDAVYSNLDYIEVFIKGFIASISIVQKYKRDVFVALVNLPYGFVETFCKISVNIGVRKFPEKMQIYLCEKDNNNMISLLGTDYSQVLQNSYILSLEQGRDIISKREIERAKILKNILEGNIDKPLILSEKRDVFPFDVILTTKQDNNTSTIFENCIKELANQSLDSDLVGYKLSDTHMRLGSKVHIESFYEMSFLFYRTTVANKIAFIILRHLYKHKEDKIDIDKDNIIFYGYASYSKAILTSITEILQAYRKIECNTDKKNIAFASYQHNLQLESEEIQMYYSLPKDYKGSVVDKNKLKIDEKTAVVQIVPISSTLTTFDKMWNKFRNSLVDTSINNIILCANYTFFWVVDKDNKNEEFLPSDIEENYWEKVEPDRNIVMKFEGLKNAQCEETHFLMNEAVVWHNPLECKLCYPNFVLDEIPLVETDPTSTVPTQQIRHRMYQGQGGFYENKENIERIIDLKDCIQYGHISRRQNHYQYYIDTQKYFYKVKDKVKRWLKNLRGNEESSIDDKTILNIIFSPEHNTNVGFAQFVNSYYFDGLAEIVSLNVDKVFRSNFICEHSALLSLIRRLYNDMENKNFSVRFYFVDDTIITGETISKANSLLYSLLPKEENSNKHNSLFTKIFVLMDRLSDETKKMYVNDIKNNFLYFVHIDISNMRTQGDSCVGCKLEQDAERMFKRSATKTLAGHWANKLRNYHAVPYDDPNSIVGYSGKNSYYRLIISHVLQNIIVKSGSTCEEGGVYDRILNLCMWLLNKEIRLYDEFNIYETLLIDLRNEEGIKQVLKVICRPFFTYEFKIRFEVMTFFIFTTESILNVDIQKHTIDEKSKKKKFLLKNNRIERTNIIINEIKKRFFNYPEEEVCFLQRYLLEGLTDMHSTYLLRKQTIQKAYNYMKVKAKSVEEKTIEEFWNNYIIDVYRLISNSSDETKELGMQFLLFTGKEYRDLKKEKKEPYLNLIFLYEEITGKSTIEDDRADKSFYLFCHELFLLNTGINFDGIEKMCNLENKQVQTIVDHYFMDYWRQLQKLEHFELPTKLNDVEKAILVNSEKLLFEFLAKERVCNEDIPQSVSKWYEELLEKISDVLSEKYELCKNDINIAILTDRNDRRQNDIAIENLDIVKACINHKQMNLSEVYFSIKNRIIEAINDKSVYDLENKGYFISNQFNSLNRSYLILCFDNPETDFDDNFRRSLKRITRVYMYVSIGKRIIDESEKAKETREQFYLLLILRTIMMYRNQILRFLELDFEGDIFSSYAHTLGEKNVLSHIKAKSHNTTADDKISIEMFTEDNFDNYYQYLQRDKVAEWLTLRNYTNGQIAKIFNRSFRDEKERNTGETNIPPYYVLRNSTKDKMYKQKLEHFTQLGIFDSNNKVDGRFKMLREIIDIKFETEILDAEFICNKKGEGYNLEYFKCILIDIFISAMKYCSSQPDYLLRIEKYIKINNNLSQYDEGDKFEIKTWLESQKCTVCIMVEEIGNNDSVDYLVIRNPVDKLTHRLQNWEKRNEIIQHRLQDPLDYVDGHMSLLTIKRYVENLEKSLKVECSFGYRLEEINNILYFETKLPVLKKRRKDNGNR